MKSWFENNWFKILAAALLVGALGRHPYGYYQLEVGCDRRGHPEAMRWQ